MKTKTVKAAVGGIGAAFAAVATFAVASAQGPGAAGPPTGAEQTNATARSRESLAGSAASLEAAEHGGYRITISVPGGSKALPATDDASFAAAPPSRNGAVVSLAQLGWKAELVAGVAAEQDPNIVAFAVSAPDISVSESHLLSASLRSAPGTPLPNVHPKLGTVNVGEATAQLASSLTVLRSVLPPGTIRGTRVVSVPVDRAHSLYGMEADIRVTDIALLNPHLGDVVDGLATGLVGDGTAVTEGLALNVIDDQGRRAGWWRNPRTGAGFAIQDPSEANASMRVDARFPNLTGGPRTSVSSLSPSVSSSSPSVSSSGARAPIGAATHAKNGSSTRELVPDRGIGFFRLGETREAVGRRLGPGSSPGSATELYRVGRVIIGVAYDGRNRVREIGSPSRLIALYGHTLVNEGRSVVRLRASGWQTTVCHPFVIAQHSSGSSSSQVIWFHRRLFHVGVIRSGGLPLCPTARGRG